MVTIDLARIAWRLGLRRVALYGLHQLRLRSGYYERIAPVQPLGLLEVAATAEIRNPFEVLADCTDRLPLAWVSDSCRDADPICSGEILFFGRHWRATGLATVAVPTFHWARFKDFDTRRGDIKWIWEESRFDWAYVLGRAWAHSKNERYAQCFWERVEAWTRLNPVNAGPNWKCGQECALRLIALVWAGAAFRQARASTPERTRLLWSLVAALAARIERTLGYAISQNNNHGLSETAALYLAGACLPRHATARRWRQKGRRLFDRQIGEQFALDGYYVQNSFSYTRLALRMIMVFCLTSRALGEELSADTCVRVHAAIQLLRAVTDKVTGRVPNFGGNDGANVLALSSAGYLDFRPVLQSLWYLMNGKRLYRDSVHADEELFWLGVPDWSALPMEESSCIDYVGDLSGYYVLRSGRTRAFLRCGTHRSRPAHADMLHLDIWFDGLNVARDSGTYQYFDANDWGLVLVGSAAHNVVTVNGLDQMKRLSRFLWGDWTKAATLQARLEAPDSPYFSGVHFGYRALGVQHRRTVLARDEDWLIIDDLIVDSTRPREFALYWHVDPSLGWVRDGSAISASGHEIHVHVLTEGDWTVEWLTSAATLPWNGESLYYGEITPGAVLKVSKTSVASTRFLTSIGRTKLRSCGAAAAAWRDMALPLSPA